MTLTISATNLGSYASRRFCPLCAWVHLHVKPLPYQTFPGIFSTIDRYNKLIVHRYFDRSHSLPSWLKPLGHVDHYIEPPHWKRFSVLDEETGVTLRGEADGIFRMIDGSYTIVDYKTAKYTPGQRGMFGSYEVQLNSYAYIGERLGLTPINQLALVYMEPITDEETVKEPQVVNEHGFSIGLKATIVPVELKPDKLIPPLLVKALEISKMTSPPSGLGNCKECAAVDELLEALKQDQVPPEIHFELG